MRQWKKAVIGLFIIIIFMPMFCLITGIKIEVSLTNTEPAAKPKLSLSSYLNGTYQKSFEAYWNSDYPVHNLVTKIYNQYRYSAFGEGASPYTRGRGGYIHDTNYIDEALCLDNSRKVAHDDCYRYAKLLRTVTEKLHLFGKSITLVLTPNKVSFTKDTLPYYYNYAIPAYDEESADVFRAVLADEGIDFIDSRQCLENSSLSKSAMFGKGGIHWTLSAVAECISDLYRNYDNQSGQRQNHEVELIGHYALDAPRYAQDNDIWRVLNIWTKPKDKYIYPVMSEFNIAQKMKYPRIFAQGGSFTQPLLDVIEENALADRIYFLSYEASLISWEYGNMKSSIMQSEWQSVDSFEDKKIETAINDSEWLIIEVNEAYLYHALSEEEGYGSSYLFLKTVDQILSEKLSKNDYDNKVEKDDLGVQQDTRWINFISTEDDWELMGENRGIIKLAPHKEKLTLMLKIPWRKYEDYNAGYTNQVVVLVDGAVFATIPSEGVDEQTVKIQIPEKAEEIEIYTTGIFSLEDPITPTTVFYSIYAMMGEDKQNGF